MNRQNLQDRLIDFSAAVIDLVEKMPENFACRHLGRQIIRSVTSSALNYGESQAAESRADFIHKQKIVLKELKESFVCLKILFKSKKMDKESLNRLIYECNELIAIFVTSLNTAQKKRKENH